MTHTSTVSSKGQLVIPAQLRKELGFKPGVRVAIKRHGRGLHIEARSYESVLALQGKYAGLPLESDLAEARKQDEAKLEALYESLRSRR
jgi:AbrB family looped-hinge helix DNA binding protein